jgi:GntR family transcriptional regulator, carbon starvation induced regulator
MTMIDPAARRRAPGGEKLTAATQVYGALKRDVLNGALRPGEKLQIDLVAARYGAGTNPVREALNRLSAERLVDREDQRGFRVPPLSLEHFRELVKTRCWLESLALSESIGNRTDAWEDDVVLALHRLRRTPLRYADEVDRGGGPGDNAEWEARHRAFHRALISNCGSGWLLHFCDELMDQVERFRYISMTNTYPRRDADEEHRLIAEAALAGDAPLATGRLVAQYRLTLRLFEEHVASAAVREPGD